jgi:hypothetical protein
MMYLENNDQFTVEVADTMEEAVKPMEIGFEFSRYNRRSSAF